MGIEGDARMTDAPDQKWVLITGGVMADIGKGCLAATLTRYLSACGRCEASSRHCEEETRDCECECECECEGKEPQPSSYARYLKVEPCMQQSLEAASNDEFGGIVVLGGVAVDEDVARVAFYSTPADRAAVLQAVSAGSSHVSRGTLQLPLHTCSANAVDSSCEGECTGTGGGHACDPLATATATATAGAMAQRLRAMITGQGAAAAAQVLVVELGGTAGEHEHGLMLRVLRLALGPPMSHMHLTVLLSRQGSASPVSTKAAQLSLKSLIQEHACAPDIVLLRLPQQRHGLSPTILHTAARTLKHGARLSSTTVIEVVSCVPDWPEIAYMGVLKHLHVSQHVLQLHRQLFCGIDRSRVPADKVLERLVPEEASAAQARVLVLCDGAGAAGYQSLAMRVAAWSRGQLCCAFFPSEPDRGPKMDRTTVFCSQRVGNAPQGYPCAWDLPDSSAIVHNVGNQPGQTLNECGALETVSSAVRDPAGEAPHPPSATGQLPRGSMTTLNHCWVLQHAGQRRACAVVRIGERGQVCGCRCMADMNVVPHEVGADPRGGAARVDWQGCADAPSGRVSDLVNMLLRRVGAPHISVPLSTST